MINSYKRTKKLKVNFVPKCKTFCLSLVCRCAERAKARGFTHFGLQFYGECWSGPSAESRFAMHGPSKECLMGLKFPPLYCNRTDPRACVGGPHLNFVYKIEEGESNKLISAVISLDVIGSIPCGDVDVSQSYEFDYSIF